MNANDEFTPTGPNAYQTGGMPPGGSVPVPAKRPGGLGRIALILAIVGAVFAVTRGAFVIGWLVLPVALILAIVALAQRGTRKKAAWAALAVSLLGGIAGMVAFSAAVSDAVDDAFGSGEVEVVSPSAPAEQPAADMPADDDATDEPDTDDAAGTPAGTRENPLPVGSTITSENWEVTVNSFTPDATEAVLAANTFNEAPAEGTTYALINVTITYVGEESAYAAEVQTAYVTSTGEVVDGTDSLVVAPDSIGLEELYTGGSVTGNVVRQIPAGDAGTIRVTPGWFTDDIFFGLS